MLEKCLILFIIKMIEIFDVFMDRVKLREKMVNRVKYCNFF